MKIEFIKHHGGLLSPASDIDADKMQRFKSGEQYTIEIKLSRNPQFHRKVFAFLNFCFEHWIASSDIDCLDESGQFDVFRNNLTVLAGYYDQYYNLKCEVRIEAKSLSFGSMDQMEFEKCYTALINAAMKHVFKTSDEATLNRLMEFF